MSPASIRPLRAEEAPAVRAVVQDAFGGDEGRTVADLVDTLLRTGRVRASLVAELGGRVVGHVQLNQSWVDAEERLVEVLVLSPLSVAPEHQGAGLGAALVAAAVRTAEELASPLLFLEGAPAYYSRQGFSRASEHGFVRPSVRIPDAAFQVRLLASYQSWMRGALVYCDAFWEHDAVGLRGEVLSQVRAQLGE